MSNENLTKTFVIAITFTLLALQSHNLTGSFFNPAIGISHCLSLFFITLDKKEVRYLFLYISGPIIGSFIATKVYSCYFNLFFTLKKQKIELN